MILLLGVGIGVALFILAILLRGFVLSVLWGWFVVPLGAPEIGVASALGLAITVGLFQIYRAREESEKEKRITGAALFVSPLMSLLIGWIVQFWL